MSINRTYQGRVTTVFEILDNKKLIRGRELPSEEWHLLMTRHLSLFQAATNYYLLCFAACARGSKVPALQNVVNKLTASWVTHDYRKSGEAKGFRPLLEQALPDLVGEDITFDEVANHLLDSAIPKETLHLAIEALLTDLGGESSIQQGGRSYLPYFCSPETKANFPRSPQLLEREIAKDQLPSLLHSGAIDLTELRSKYEIHHFATLSKGQDPIAGDTLRNNLAEWISHLHKEKLITADQESSWKREAAQLPDDTSIPHYSGASAKGSEKNRLYAFICAKVLSPSTDKLKVLRAAFPEPKPAKKKAAPKKLTAAQQKKLDTAKREKRLRSLGVDPIEEARGERGYVFQSFTSLLSRQDPSSGPAWTEFDIAAFKQALTALNQVDQKLVERTNDLGELEEQIGYFESKKGKPHNADEPVTFLNDPRLEVMHALEKELNELLNDDHHESSYRLARNTIKGWPIIRDGFRKILSKNDAPSEKDLIEGVIHKLQKRTKNIGSIQLFEKLAEFKYHSLWTSVPGKEISKWRSSAWSQDFLSDYVIYRMVMADADYLRENLEISLTPAHLSRSRRPLMLSDLGGASKVVHKQADEQQSLVTSFYTLDSESRTYEEKRFEVCYSSPRLKRDELTGSENRHLLQPLMKGLGLEVPTLHIVAPKSKDLAVSLMPDWFTTSPRLRTGHPDRFLLNFPAKLETDWITNTLGKAALLNPTQFNGPNDDPLHLHWPETIKLKKGEQAWWQKAEIIENGLTVAAFDLGLRGAAAAAIYHAVRDLENVPEKKQRYARRIGTAEGYEWYAYPVSRKMLRLQGEDQQVYQKALGKFAREPSGQKGRKADEVETAFFTNTFRDTFSLYLELDERDAQVPRFLIEQNTKLLRFTKRLLSYLASCHRTYIQLKVNQSLEGKKLTSLPARIRSLVEDHQPDAACDALRTQIHDIRKTLSSLLPELANRILPGRKFEWVIDLGKEVSLTNQNGKKEDFIPHTLKRRFLTSAKTQKIYGQGGLHARRLEMIEDLRRRMASYQREMNRTIGVEPTIGYGRNSGSVPDAAPELLEKLDQLKDQRVKQTAHLILTYALGLRLKGENKTVKTERPDYVHGEYEMTPDGNIADMIVIENLDRYRTDQGRSRRENRQLMAWSHRAITEVLREITTPYGIPVLALAAAYSSKFYATNSVPGFRAVEISPQQRDHFLLRNWLEGDDEKRKKVAEQIRSILETHKDKKGLKLLLPQEGGPLFVPVFDPKQENVANYPVVNADLNAAANLCLRAIAAPNRLDLLHKFRVKTGKDVLHPRCENTREKSALDPKSTLEPITDKSIRPELLAQKFSTFFYAGHGTTAHFWTPCDLFKNESTFVMSGYGMKIRISQLELPCIVAINNATLAAKGLTDRLCL